ncbi:MAG: hypothetical protein AAB965_03115, partial [Patescibacteria group bacterium]
MFTKQDILKAIKNAASRNGGKPMGSAKFEQETGIRPYDWEKYWARFSDAQKEAGFVPNERQGSYDDEFMVEKMIVLMRKFCKFPTRRDLIVQHNNDSKFPSNSAFDRRCKKDQWAEKIIAYCEEKGSHEDVVEFCRVVLKGVAAVEGDVEDDFGICEVYLFKSGRYYKIGKTGDTVRRGAEIRIQLPERMDLIHSIR